MDRRVHDAARDNARWCDIVCRTHGVTGEFRASSWTCARRTPANYPDAVTLSEAATPADVLPWIDTAAGCSVKDSFHRLDLAPAGFEVLLEAEWIHRRARALPTGAEGVRWSVIRDDVALAAWQDAWGADDEPGPFRRQLLDEPSVLVVAGYRDGRVVAGAVLSSGSTVVGVSNVFAADGDLDAAWPGVLGLAARHHPGLPVVGYEHGDALAAAVRTGFEPIGGLRVWVRPHR
ncbi:hypothetical protein [Actinophytocola sediminis]